MCIFQTQRHLRSDMLRVTMGDIMDQLGLEYHRMTLVCLVGYGCNQIPFNEIFTDLFVAEVKHIETTW